MKTPPNFPQTGFLRLAQIIAPNGPIPVAKSTFYAWIAASRAPKPVRLPGSRVALWRAEDILQLMAEARHD